MTELPTLVCAHTHTHTHMHVYSHAPHGEALETRKKRGFNLGQRSGGHLRTVSMSVFKGFFPGRGIRINLNSGWCSLSAYYVPSSALGAFISSVNPSSNCRRDPTHSHLIGDKAEAQM